VLYDLYARRAELSIAIRALEKVHRIRQLPVSPSVVSRLVNVNQDAFLEAFTYLQERIR
jgi:hypothetical protein